MINEAVNYMNPIRFRHEDVYIDSFLYFPNYDKMTQREQYQKGIYAQANYRPNFLTNKTIYIEIFDPVNVNYAIVRNLDTGIFTNMTITPITPPGWVSDKIFRVSATVSTSGYYQIEIEGVTNGRYYSDEFYVKTGINKDLVQINYYDSLNRNGGFFFIGGATTPAFNPVAYYTGILRKAATEYERSAYNNQPNNTLILRNTPKIKETLIITDLHETYYDNLSFQFSCDNLIINGVSYSVEEFGEPSYVDDKSDIMNVTITLSRNKNNNFMKFS